MTTEYKPPSPTVLYTVSGNQYSGPGYDIFGYTAAQMHEAFEAGRKAESERMKHLLVESQRILHEGVRHAIRKIKVERIRGAGYYHAEVDWLLNEEQAVRELMGKLDQEVKYQGWVP